MVGGRISGTVSLSFHAGESGTGWIQVGPARAAATQGIRLNGAPESDAMSQRPKQFRLWAPGQAICAVGRTLREERAATRQYG